MSDKVKDTLMPDFCGIRDGGDEIHIECRFPDGQKYAAVTVDIERETLAEEIATFINTRAKILTGAKADALDDLIFYKKNLYAQDLSPEEETVEICIAALRDQSADLLDESQEALHKIKQWCDAYPVEVFIPVSSEDMKRADQILKDAGINMSAMHGEWARHITSGMSKIVDAYFANKKPVELTVSNYSIETDGLIGESFTQVKP